MRLDTPGCYRGIWWVLIGALATPFLVAGCAWLQASRIGYHVHRAEHVEFRFDCSDRLAGYRFVYRGGMILGAHPYGPTGLDSARRGGGG